MMFKKSLTVYRRLMTDNRKIFIEPKLLTQDLFHLPALSQLIYQFI